MRDIKGGLDAIKKANPNFAEIAAKRGVPSFRKPPTWWPIRCRSLQFTAGAEEARVAADEEPREAAHRHAARAEHVLAGAALHGLLRVAGHPAREPRLLRLHQRGAVQGGAKRGSIDPCFPRKVGIPHVHNLLYVHHAEEAARHHLLPDDRLPASRSWSSVQATAPAPPSPPRPRRSRPPSPRKATCSRRRASSSSTPFVNFGEARAVRAADVRAVQGHPRPVAGREPARRRAGLQGAATTFNDGILRERGREVLEQARSARTASASCCWAVRTTTIRASTTRSWRSSRSSATRCFTQDSLPLDDDILWRLFGDEVRRGRHQPSPWTSPTSGRTPTARTPAARCGRPSTSARHPNLVALELSSFKCGHDAPIYTVVEEIVETVGHAVLLLQGHRREQAHRLDPDSRRDHRLLPEALPRRHGRATRRRRQTIERAAARSSQAPRIGRMRW